ncbi:hypothetical protein C1I98_26445 [Spongiactinospora gelatinilytica]|uniref:ABC transmembrane type-1 domain-containing protein n=1 Tax=Spongiactinospora gelatinilytica TaxID=2666298 RepID=A0A2W2FHM2_9ACTN|nr:hypothetical protein [Spongiactinospora gelatinilytica]PZG36776.1 hypothetical protein C1I98_26445 [Spongiactinospora gelatinilytica]
MLAGVVAVVLAVDPRVGGALLAYCALAGFLMARAQKVAVPSAARSREAGAVMYGHLEERLAAMEDIRASCGCPTRSCRWPAACCSSCCSTR